MKYYTYFWFREDGTPYYIGKGSGNRAFISQGHGIHKPKEKSRIFVQYWESEDKAFEMERWWIAFFGRKDNSTGILRNLTDGGENPPSWRGKKRIHSKETKNKIAEKTKKLWEDPEYKQHMSDAHKGQVVSEHTKRRLSEVHKGHKYNLGRKRSEETKLKMGAAQLGRKHSEETLSKLRAAATERERRKRNAKLL